MSTRRVEGSKLYRENTRLTQSVQALTVRGRETESQLRDADARVDELAQQLQARDAEHGGLVEEVQRLRTLEKFNDPNEVLQLRQQLTEQLTINGLQAAELKRLQEVLALDDDGTNPTKVEGIGLEPAPDTQGAKGKNKNR